MLSLYADHNFHSGAIDGVQLRGIDCLTALQDGRAKAKDPAILQRATDLRRVVITQDTDLIDIAWEWIALGRPFHGVIYVPQNALSVGQIISDLQLIAELSSDHEIMNAILRLPL